MHAVNGEWPWGFSNLRTEVPGPGAGLQLLADWHQRRAVAGSCAVDGQSAVQTLAAVLAMEVPILVGHLSLSFLPPRNRETGGSMERDRIDKKRKDRRIKIPHFQTPYTF